MKQGISAGAPYEGASLVVMLCILIILLDVCVDLATLLAVLVCRPERAWTVDLSKGSWCSWHACGSAPLVCNRHTSTEHGDDVCAGSNVVSVAEHVVMMILALVRNYMTAHYQVGICEAPLILHCIVMITRWQPVSIPH